MDAALLSARNCCRSKRLTYSNLVRLKQGSLVFDGSIRPAWVWDIRRISDGWVAAVFVVSHEGLDGFDLRYYYAHVLDGVWQTQEIAYAGKHIYSPENHYAGGVFLDPSDLNVVYMSCNVDPLSGTPSNGGRDRLFWLEGA